MGDRQALGMPLSPLQQEVWDLYIAEPHLSRMQMAERLTETSGRPVTALAVDNAIRRARIRLGEDASPLEKRKPNKYRERRVLAEVKKEVLGHNFSQIAVEFTESILRMSPEEIDRLPAKERIIVAGISTDKRQVLRGEPSVIVQHQDSGALQDLLLGALGEARRRGLEIDITPKTEDVVEVEYRAIEGQHE